MTSTPNKPTIKKPTGTVFLRGPMGEYIPESEEKQFLTNHARAMPGPSDYVSGGKPKSAAGEWSIVGKPKDIPVPVGPPPSRYGTGTDRIRKY